MFVFEPVYQTRLAAGEQPDLMPEGGTIKQMDDPIRRAAAARVRARQAAEAAARARARAHAATSSETLAEAEERRLHAEERLAAARAELAKALERSRNAHLAASLLDPEKGDEANAARHRAAAREDRREREDLAP